MSRQVLIAGAFGIAAVAGLALWASQGQLVWLVQTLGFCG